MNAAVAARRPRWSVIGILIAARTRVLHPGPTRRGLEGARRADRRSRRRHPARLGARRAVPRHPAVGPAASSGRSTASPRSCVVDNEQFDGRPHGFVNTLLGLFGALALLAAVITLFRSQRSNNALTGNDESALRGLLARYGGDDSLGYFATRRDKAVVFARAARRRDHLPGRARGLPGQRRSDRRPGGLAARDRALARPGAHVRLGAGGDGRRARTAPPRTSMPG